MTATKKPAGKNARQPPALPRFRTLDNAPSRGAWMPAMGHTAATPALPPGFSPPRFTPQQQAANPGEPMTRLVKDVLKVGRWKVGEDVMGKPRLWNVTVPILQQLAAAHGLAASRGVAMNLTLSHGNLQTGIVPTNELIAPIDEMVIHKGCLWVSVYVTPQQAKFLRNPACKVSPGIWDDWSDGLGNHYPSKMLHVAVTDNPVIPGQGPFVVLANRQKRNLNARGTKMDFDALKAEIEVLLDALSPGAALPADVTEETIVRDLRMVSAALGLSSGGGDGLAPDAGSVEDALAGGLGMSNRYRRANGRPTPRRMSNAGRRRPTDQQCEAAASRFFGVVPRKPA